MLLGSVITARCWRTIDFVSAISRKEIVIRKKIENLKRSFDILYRFAGYYANIILNYFCWFYKRLYESDFEVTLIFYKNMSEADLYRER